MQQIDAIHGRRQDLLQRLEPGLGSRARFGNFKNEALCFINDFRRGASVGAKCGAADFVADTDQRPQHRAFPEDPGVGSGVGCARRFVRYRCQVLEPPGLFEFAATFQALGNGDDIAGIRVFGKGRDGGKDQAVVFAIEVLVRDDVCDLVPGAVIEHEAAEQRLLRFDRMRRYRKALLATGGRNALIQSSNHLRLSPVFCPSRLRYHRLSVTQPQQRAL